MIKYQNLTDEQLALIGIRDRTVLQKHCQPCLYFLGGKYPQIKVHCNDHRSFLTPVKACKIHTRCLPDYTPEGHKLDQWNERPESKIYHLCNGCSDYNPKP